MRFSKGSFLSILLPATMLLPVATNHAVGIELTPNPNPGGNTITIDTPDVESHAEPYKNFGTIDIVSGGVLTNFREFTILSGTVSIESEGTLVNDAEEGVFVVDEVGSLYSSGTIDNYGRMKNSWSFGNRLGSVFNNYLGAELTNTRGMDQRGVLLNAGGFLNSVDVFSGDGAGLQNVGTWTNSAGSTFTNLGVVENFGAMSNSGFLQNRLGASGGITQGKFSNRNTVENLPDGVISNEHRWFNRASSAIENSGTSTNSARGLGLSNEAGSTINNLSGGTFQNDRVINNAGEIHNGGTFIINSGFSLSSAVQGAGTYTQTSGETTVLSSLAGSQLEFRGGVVLGTGSLVGPVTIFPDATMRPGNPAGLLAIDGSLELGGMLAMEIETAALFGTVDVTGDATLGNMSEISVSLGDDFTPAPLQTYTILTATTLSGEFGNAAHGTRVDTLGGEGSFLVSYDGTGNSVVLSDFLSPSQDADFDTNGVVDGSDFLIWQDNFGTQAGATSNYGDADGDGDVDGEDFLMWQTQFGRGVGDTRSAAGVPEPTAALLLCVAAALVSWCSNPQSQRGRRP